MPDEPRPAEELTHASAVSTGLGPAASVFLPLSACALLLAWALGGVALVFAALMLSALACSWFLGRRNLQGLCVRSPRTELRTVGEEFLLELEVALSANAGSAHDLVLSLERSRGRPAGLVTWLEAGRSTRTPLALKLTERGPVRQVELTIESSYPFGLFSRRAHFRLPVDLLALPRLGSLADLARLESRGRDASQWRQLQLAGGDELRSLVEWRPGMSLRRAHWKLSARRGKPLIVEREERSAPPVTILLSNATSGPRPARAESFEVAVSLTATLCEHYLRRGVSVRLLVSGDGHEQAPRLHGRDGLASCLVRLAHVELTTADGQALSQGPIASQVPFASQGPIAQPRGEALILVHSGGSTPLPAAAEATLVLDVEAPGLDDVFLTGRSFGSSPALSWSDAG